MFKTVLYPKTLSYKDETQGITKVVALSEESAARLFASTNAQEQAVIDAIVARITPALPALPAVKPNLANDQLTKWTMLVDKETSQLPQGGVLSLYAVILLRYPAFGATVADRRNLLYHMFTLIRNESRWDPKASYVETIKNGTKKVGAYGLFSHRRSNWADHSNKFKDSPSGRQLIRTGLFSNLSRLLRLDTAGLINPLICYGPEYVEMYQLVPMLGQTIMLKAAVSRLFIFSASGWTPKSEGRRNSALWNKLVREHSAIFRNYDTGYQALVTLMHINGVGFLYLDKTSHSERLVSDVSLFVGIAHSPVLATFIARAVNYWNRFLPLN